MSEFDLIRRYFHWQNPPPSVRVSVGDDAALLIPPPQQELVISVDTLNAGVHFPLETPPHAIGYKALAVNLSDLAAMGASPAWFTLAISLPEANEAWLSEFARGMQELAQAHRIFLVGGDTTRGSLSITIQVMGWRAPQQGLLRSQAQVGDLICVSGSLGDGAAGLAIVQNRLNLPEKAAEFCVNRLNYPTPRNKLGESILPYANAAMDISDGLLGDLQHILKASQVGAKIHHKQIPISPALQLLPVEHYLDFALRGGDDYELLFTLQPQYLDTVKNLSNQLNINISMIGKITENVQKIDLDYTFSDKRKGYDHFSSA